MAIRVLQQWQSGQGRIDNLLAKELVELRPVERQRVQHLLYGVVRHSGLLRWCLDHYVKRWPRRGIGAVLMLAAFEMHASSPETPGEKAKIVDHAVRQAKSLSRTHEAGLVNAVLRKLAAEGPALLEQLPAGAEGWAIRWSHPEWLVHKWRKIWGEEATQALLQWNQQPAVPYLYHRKEEIPEWAAQTKWPGFYQVREGTPWSLVQEAIRKGYFYAQDPMTQKAVHLLDPRTGECLLDLCAAPGGKTGMLAKAVGEGGEVLAADLPGVRMRRMRENAARTSGGQVHCVEVDLLKPWPKRLPIQFAGVLIDVPCSNTGVFRRRLDVKYRLHEGEFAELAELQSQLLEQAALRVAPGGRLVYATCSLEPEENQEVIDKFLESPLGKSFTLAASAISLPWVEEHDGGGAFRLERRS